MSEENPLGPKLNLDPVALISDSFSGKTGNRIKRLMTLWVFGAATYESAKAIYTWWEGRNKWSVVVRPNDTIYDDVQEWLFNTYGLKNLKNVEIKTLTPSNGSRSSIKQVREEKAKSLMAMRWPTSTYGKITVEGHKIQVFKMKASVDDANSAMSNAEFARAVLSSGSIHFHASSEAGRTAVLNAINELVEKRYSERRSPGFNIGFWGDWSKRSNAPSRDPRTIALKEGQLEALIKDLDVFLASEDEYHRLGIPYHRGYLLYGPPGTGKTSIAKALSTHFNLDVYYISLSDIRGDNYLMTLVSEVPSGAILLIEDIDILKAAKDREENDDADNDRVTLSGLLNCLDGFSTPNGLISILTTNRREALDDALIRPGRVDVAEYIGYIDNYQAHRLFDLVFGSDTEFSVVSEDDQITGAEFIELLRHSANPDDAVAAIGSRVKSHPPVAQLVRAQDL